jgi:hypothetical protein
VTLGCFLSSFLFFAKFDSNKSISLKPESHLRNKNPGTGIPVGTNTKWLA